MIKIINLFTSSADGNLAFHVKDNKNSVSKNREKLALKHNFDIHTLRYMNQVHSNHIEIVTEISEQCIDNCDALITNKVNLPLLVMVADCIPILLKDEKKGVIAAIHAGRNSTFLQISKRTVEKMMNHFDCNPQDIKACFGPSIQKCCYEVSADLVNIVKTSFGESFVDNRLIDLQGINQKQLNEVGVKQFEISSICTHCSNKPYYSYRKNKNTGRFAGLIMLNND